MSYAAEKRLVDRAEAAIVHAAAIARSNDFSPMLPFELVEATEHHGPYITTAFGTTVCDFYCMSNPLGMSLRNGGNSRVVKFTDADENAAFMARAANAHEALVAACERLDNWWLETFPGGPDGDRAWAGGLGQLSEDTIEVWREIRAAIALARGGSELQVAA